MKIRIIYTFVLFFLPFLLFSQIVGIGYGNKGVGFKDKNGAWIVKPIYEDAKWDQFTKIGVLKNSKQKWGAVDEYGKSIIPFEYDEIVVRLSDYRVNDHIHVTQVKGGLEYTGLWDKRKGLLVPCEFESVYDYDKAITVKTQDGLFGLYNYEGEKILEPIYSKFLCFNSDFPEIQLLNKGGKGDIYKPEGGKWGAVDYRGNIIVPCDYEACVLTDTDIFPVKKNGKWGYFSQGKEIIECVYDNVTPFKDDVAQVRKGQHLEIIKNPLKNGDLIKTGEVTSLTLASRNKDKSSIDRKVVSRYPPANSDIDTNIPVAKTPQENTFAFIIANENYKEAPVPFALNDGWKFKEYMEIALGIPEQNINLYEDATYATIVSAVERMKSIATAYEGNASFIFYYAGHGFPDEKLGSAYLLPIDGSASDITVTGYSLSKLYDSVSKLPLKSAIFFLDACFSGAVREDKMLAESRGVAIKVKEDVPQGNLIVFSASQGDETAHQLENKHHGLFTYYLLKGIQENGQDVNLGTLTSYVTRMVKRQSVVINNKKQTPSVVPSQSLNSNWVESKIY